MTDWISTTIGTQVLLQRGVDITKSQQRLGTIPVVSSGGISSYHDTAIAKAPGVVLGRKGTLGSVFYLEQDYWPHDTTLWVKDFKGNIPRFVYYFFRSMSAELLALDNATANPALNRNHVHPIEVLWPSRLVQQSIVDVLGALDDKIAANRALNSRLQELLAALFQSWFVDFEPVAAKREGRPPIGVPMEAVGLFPSHFEDSELGAVPRDWRHVTISDLAEVNALTASPKTLPPEIQYIEISDVHRGDIERPTLYRRGCEPSRARRIVKDGDTVLSAVRPERGAYFLCLDPPPNLVVSTGFVVLTPRSKHWPLVYCAATSEDALEHYERHAEGGAYPAMRPDSVASLRVAMPIGSSVAEVFCSLAEPLLRHVHANRVENDQLADLRDALLGPLVSGELAIHAAEKTVGAAV
jgi:type I restriction enzyme S subunit